MMTVRKVSALTGVSPRTLQYYDAIGLLPPAKRTEAGYRLYDEGSLERLQQILLLRELEFSLKDIGNILSRPDFDASLALEQQIRLLEMKKEQIENRLNLARQMKKWGVSYMKNLPFEPVDWKKYDEYVAQAKAAWGETDAYREYERKYGGRSREERQAAGAGMMAIFAEFGQVKALSPAGAEAQALVRKLRDYITGHFYTCTPEILSCLGGMYAGGGDYGKEIDKAGGAGTADFAARAIAAYCESVRPGP